MHLDFGVIERHPWISITVILLGGFLLFLIFARRHNAATGGSAVYVSQGTDPNAAAANVAAQQIQGQLGAIQLTSQRDITIAGLSAEVQRLTIDASRDVTNRQTDAQLQLGMGTLGSQVALAQINADVSMKYIDALVSAFRGSPGSAPVSSAPSPVYYGPGTPIPAVTPQNVPPVPVTALPPGGTGSGGFAGPGGSPGFVSMPDQPTYIPVGAWPDAAAVAANQQTQIGYENSVLAAQAQNNQAQCFANAELSRGYPNYAALVAACGGAAPSGGTPTAPPSYTAPPPTAPNYAANPGGTGTLAGLLPTWLQRRDTEAIAAGIPGVY